MAKTPTIQVETNSQTVSEELRQFIEQLESLEADKKAIADDIKEKFMEIKGRGYDTKALRKIIAERKRDKDDLAEENAIVELYRQALGMDDGLV